MPSSLKRTNLSLLSSVIEPFSNIEILTVCVTTPFPSVIKPSPGSSTNVKVLGLVSVKRIFVTPVWSLSLIAVEFAATCTIKPVSRFLPLYVVLPATRSISLTRLENSELVFSRSLSLKTEDPACIASWVIRVIMAPISTNDPSATCNMENVCWILREPSEIARISEAMPSAKARLAGSSLERLTLLPDDSWPICRAVSMLWIVMLRETCLRWALWLIRAGISMLSLNGLKSWN